MNSSKKKFIIGTVVLMVLVLLIVPAAAHSYDCDEIWNPAGKTIPPAGWIGYPDLPGPKGGMNDDGFYTLKCADYLQDDGQYKYMYIDAGGLNGIFGFSCSDYSDVINVKYTQAPGKATPTINYKIGGPNSAIDAHIIGTNELVFGPGDESGVYFWRTCFVPPPLK